MTRRLLWTALAVLALAAPVQAQSSAGVRAGVSGDPDQFFFGGHVETRPVVDRLTFRPNAEVGLGDGITLIALNIEFAYWLRTGNREWRVYLGGGPAANILSNGDTHVEGGFNLLIGAQHNRGLFTELKVGLGDSPAIKVAVGYVFK